jgi:GNAT superfamily N-acetyltransferase
MDTSAGKTTRTAILSTVRPAQFSDALAVARLSGQLGYPATTQEIETRLCAVEGNLEHAIFVAEGVGGDVVGWVHIFLLRSLETGTRAEVGGLVVDEAHRSQGAGRQLLERAEEWARGSGCRSIGLRSNVIRERAHAFYERLGYRVIKTQKAFRKEL